MMCLRNACCAAIAASFLAFGCDDPEHEDGGVTGEDASAMDAAAPMDAGPEDAGAGDAGAEDAATPVDGGHDAGSDAGPIDAGPDPASIPAPRPITPASTGLTTSLNVHFRWELTAPATGAFVDICRDSACASVIETRAVDGEEMTYPAAPPPDARILYFRLAGRVGSVRGSAQSPIWSFSARGSLATTVSATWGSTHDFDADGLSDVLGGAPDSSEARLYRGQDGAAPTNTTTISGVLSLRIGTALFSAGDVNGDGLADLAVGTADDLWIFHGVAGGFPSSLTPGDADVTLAGVTPTARTATMAGDVDRDGYADIVLGDPSAGQVLLYRGGPTGIDTTGVPVTHAAGGFGTSVEGGCDVNADGYSDVIVGATDAAYVLLGGASGLDGAAAQVLTAGPSAAGFGASVACAGDINGDGYADVIVGAPDDDAAFVYHGNATGTFGAPNGALRKVPGASTGGTNLDAFGWMVASAGDVNGDGYGDLAVVAPELCTGCTGTLLSAFVFHGSASGVAVTAPGSSTPSQRATAYGTVTSRTATAQYAGDVNGDGYDDLLTGAPYRNSGRGELVIYRGEDRDTAPALVGAYQLAGSLTSSGLGTTL